MKNRTRSVADDRGAQDVPARDPFVRQVATVVTMVAVAGLLLALLVLGINVFLAAFAGVLLAVLLRALTDLVTSYTALPDGWAFALVLLLLVAGLGVGGWLLAPQVAEQANAVGEQLPGMIGEAEAFLREHGWGQWLLERMQGGGEGGMGNLGAVLAGAAQWMTYLLTTLFVGLFAAANPRLYQDGIVHLFPLRHRRSMRELLGEIGYTLRWWLIGRAIAMAMVGITTALVLGLLGVQFALLLGLVAGLLTFVPYLGPIVAGVPIVLFAALDGPDTALWVLLAYTAIQQVEGNVLDPIIMHKLIYIPPVLTIVIQVLMGVVVGVMGIAMATPLAAVLIVLNRFYRRDILGDPRAEEEEDEEDREDEEVVVAVDDAHRRSRLG
jgi:predicted PurR-regulated permease PerM